MPALYPYPEEQTGELACVVIHPDYRKGNRGDRLIKEIKTIALTQGLKSIFVLTTVSSMWFQEQGFIESNIDALPSKKKELYNFQRNSKVLVKPI